MTKKPDITKSVRLGRTPVAEICFYGDTHGAGYITRTYDGRIFGDGTPVEGRSLTDTLWLACDELYRHNYGAIGSRVHVFEPRGERMAIINFQRPGLFGDLKWHPAPVYVITTEALLAAATDPK